VKTTQNNSIRNQVK